MNEVVFKLVEGEKINGRQMYNLICISGNIEWILYVWDFYPDHEEICDVKTTILRAWRFYHKTLQIPSFDIGVETEVRVWKNIFPIPEIVVEADTPIPEKTTASPSVSNIQFKVGDSVRNKLKPGYIETSYSRKIGIIKELLPNKCVVVFDDNKKNYYRPYEQIELIDVPVPVPVLKLKKSKMQRCKIIEPASKFYNYIGKIIDIVDDIVEVEIVDKKMLLQKDEVTKLNARDVNFYKGDIVNTIPDNKIGTITKVLGTPKNHFVVSIGDFFRTCGRSEMVKIKNR